MWSTIADLIPCSLVTSDTSLVVFKAFRTASMGMVQTRTSLGKHSGWSSCKLVILINDEHCGPSPWSAARSLLHTKNFWCVKLWAVGTLEPKRRWNTKKYTKNIPIDNYWILEFSLFLNAFIEWSLWGSQQQQAHQSSWITSTATMQILNTGLHF